MPIKIKTLKSLNSRIVASKFYSKQDLNFKVLHACMLISSRTSQRRSLIEKDSIKGKIESMYLNIFFSLDIVY